MNTFAIVILVALVGEYLLGAVSGLLSARSFSPAVPAEFAGVFDDEKYARARRYTATRTRFGLLRGGFDLAVVLAFWFAGGFAWLDGVVRGLGQGPVVTGLAYIGALVIASTLLGLPFRAWSTFVIEARYGFNRTTPGTFAADLLKGLGPHRRPRRAAAGRHPRVLRVGGAPGVAVVLDRGDRVHPRAAVHRPDLDHAAVQHLHPPRRRRAPRRHHRLYARSAKFPLGGIFVVDGSRRSSKANAFFTGFGKHKRIGLFDTLVDQYTVPELVAVVAHEIGHYKKRHVWLQMALSIGHLGAMLWVLSIFLGQEGLFAAFYVSEPSVYAGLLFFSLLFTPVELVLSVLMHVFSRRHEFEADRFAAETTGGGAPLVSALKKLSADNLNNLTPHPLDVFLHYSHPPVLRRIDALQRPAAG